MKLHCEHEHIGVQSKPISELVLNALKYFLYSLGIEYSSYSISKLLQVFASENVFRAQVLGSIPEQLEEVYQTR